MEVKLRLRRPTVNLRICWSEFESQRRQLIHPFMDSTEEIKLVRLLLARLERVSVDSYWAHRASGIRGAFLRTLEDLEKGTDPGQTAINELISSAFKILTRAAREKHLEIRLPQVFPMKGISLIVVHLITAGGIIIGCNSAAQPSPRKSFVWHGSITP